MPATHAAQTLSDAPSLPRTGFITIRIMLAAYFLASATALFFDPLLSTPFDKLMPSQQAQMLGIYYLLATSTAIMLGVCVRPAALLLAGYVFADGYLQLGMAATIADLSAFWGEMAMIGALLLIALIEPGGSRRFSSAPARAPRPAAPKPAKRRVHRDDIPLTRATPMADQHIDEDNIFAELMDRSRAKSA